MNEAKRNGAGGQPSAQKSEFVRRVGLYGGAALVFGALIYGGFIYPKSVDAEPGQLISMVEVHLKVVAMIPPDASKGGVDELRREHLEQARDLLDRFERAAPGMAIACEYRAFAATLEDKPVEAARYYREAIDRCETSGDDSTRQRLNLVRCVLSAQGTAAARQELEKIDEERRDSDWHVLLAKIEHEQGNKKGQSKALTAAFRAAGMNEKTQKIVADAAFDLGDAIALSCYTKLGKKDLSTWYRIAKLKVEIGELDSASKALARIRDKHPELLKELLERDQQFWNSHQTKGFNLLSGESRGTVASPSK